jgi:hypothetical protein
LHQSLQHLLQCQIVLSNPSSYDVQHKRMNHSFV